jgi:outer membrane protein
VRHARRALLLAPLEASPAEAETLNGALLRAYNSCPLMNSSRAGVRALDDKVPKARAGLRPRANAGAFLGARTIAR